MEPRRGRREHGAYDYEPSLQLQTSCRPLPLAPSLTIILEGSPLYPIYTLWTEKDSVCSTWHVFFSWHHMVYFVHYNYYYAVLYWHIDSHDGLFPMKSRYRENPIGSKISHPFPFQTLLMSILGSITPSAEYGEVLVSFITGLLLSSSLQVGSYKV